MTRTIGIGLTKKLFAKLISILSEVTTKILSRNWKKKIKFFLSV